MANDRIANLRDVPFSLPTGDGGFGAGRTL
jgi:hypothetical protein